MKVRQASNESDQGNANRASSHKRYIPIKSEAVPPGLRASLRDTSPPCTQTSTTLGLPAMVEGHTTPQHNTTTTQQQNETKRNNGQKEEEHKVTIINDQNHNAMQRLTAARARDCFTIQSPSFVSLIASPYLLISLSLSLSLSFTSLPASISIALVVSRCSRQQHECFICCSHCRGAKYTTGSDQYVAIATPKHRWIGEQLLGLVWLGLYC
jgi:hypothetical protein